MHFDGNIVQCSPVYQMIISRYKPTQSSSAYTSSFTGNYINVLFLMITWKQQNSGFQPLQVQTFCMDQIMNTS